MSSYDQLRADAEAQIARLKATAEYHSLWGSVLKFSGVTAAVITGVGVFANAHDTLAAEGIFSVGAAFTGGLWLGGDMLRASAAGKRSEAATMSGALLVDTLRHAEE